MREQALSDALMRFSTWKAKWRAQALAELAPQLTSDFLRTALTVARTISGAHYRSTALVALALSLPEEERTTVLAEALAAVALIADESTRADALNALAPKLSGGLLPDALATARGIHSDDARARAVAALVLHHSIEPGSQATGEAPDVIPTRQDVYISHHPADTTAAEELARRLVEAGKEPTWSNWLEKQGVIEKALERMEAALHVSSACLVLIGPAGLGTRQSSEMRAALQRAVETNNDLKVFSVLLPGAAQDSVSEFLNLRPQVDFRNGLDDPIALRRLLTLLEGKAVDLVKEAAEATELAEMRAQRREFEQALWHFSQAQAIFRILDDRQSEAAVLSRMEAIRLEIGEQKPPADHTSRCDVYLSHSTVDQPAVNVIARRLQKAGVKCWLAELILFQVNRGRNRLRKR